MPGIQAPTIEAVAAAIKAVVAAVVGIPAEVVHDRVRLVLTEDQLAIVGYDQATKALHYWEIELVGAREEEIDERGRFIDIQEYAIRGVYGYSDGAGSQASTPKWRALVRAVRDAVRGSTAIFGIPYQTSRATRLADQRLISWIGGGVVHYADIRIQVESVADVDLTDLGVS